MPQGRAGRVAVVAVAGVVVLGVVWVAVTVARTVWSARQLQTDVASAAAHARALDLAALSTDLQTTQGSAADLQSQASGPVWSGLGRLPGIGATARTVQVLADAAVAAADAGQQFVPVLPALAPDRLRRPDGSIDVEALQRLGDLLEQSATDLNPAAVLAATADPDAIGPVGDAATQAREALVGLPERIRAAAQATRVTAQLLGAEGTTSTLFLLQNGSEARGTGGFVGAYALADARAGHVSVRGVDTNNSLATPIPNDMMSKQFFSLWDRSDTAEWNSYNQTRHFPYVGRLSAAGMAARGTAVDAVVAIDAYAVAALLAGTGPISALGETVDSQTAVEFFNRTVYERYPDVATKDRVVVALMEALLGKLTDGAVDVPAMLQAMAPVVGDERVRVWSADPATQQQLEQWSVGGVVPETPGPWVAVALNNSAGNKLDAFVSSSVHYEANTCGTGPSTVRVTLTNTATGAGSPYAYSRKYFALGRPGTTRLMVDVYGPVGAQWRSAVLDGEREYFSQGRERRHPVWIYDMVLAPGQTSSLTVTFREPKSALSPTVVPQAMALPQATTTTSVCSAK